MVHKVGALGLGTTNECDGSLVLLAVGLHELEGLQVFHGHGVLLLGHNLAALVLHEVGLVQAAGGVLGFTIPHLLLGTNSTLATTVSLGFGGLFGHPF